MCARVFIRVLLFLWLRYWKVVTIFLNWRRSLAHLVNYKGTMISTCSSRKREVNGATLILGIWVQGFWGENGTVIPGTNWIDGFPTWRSPRPPTSTLLLELEMEGERGEEGVVSGRSWRVPYNRGFATRYNSVSNPGGPFTRQSLCVQSNFKEIHFLGFKCLTVL